MNINEFSTKVAKEHVEKIADINKADAWEMRDLVKYKGADIQKFEMLNSFHSYNDTDNDKNREAIFCGYDFTKRIEILAQPGVYLDALECLNYKGDEEHGFLNPEDSKRLKKQCVELVSYMDGRLKSYLADYLHKVYNKAACKDIENKYRSLKQTLEIDKTEVQSDPKKVVNAKASELSATKETAVESISPIAREKEKRAELKRRKEERVSNRLAGARKTLAKQIDKTLGTNLTDRKIPEKAKKVERKINDALFSSKSGKEAE